jgi:hypothetical protein
MFDVEYLSKKKDMLTCVTVEHWHHGLAQVHRFEIRPGDDDMPPNVLYRNRYTAHAMEDKLREYGRSKEAFIASDPNRLFVSSLSPKTLESKGATAANANRAIYPFFPLGRLREESGGQLVAQADVNLLQEIDPITLIPKRLFSFATVNPDFKGIAAGCKIANARCWSSEWAAV